jgi:hypothetical protein
MPRFITLECASIEARHVAAVVARVSVSLHFGRFPKSLTPQPRLNLCARRGVPVVVGVAGSAKHTLLCSLVGTFYEWYVPAHDFLFHTARTDMQTGRHPSRTHTLGTSTSFFEPSRRLHTLTLTFNLRCLVAPRSISGGDVGWTAVSDGYVPFKVWRSESSNTYAIAAARTKTFDG